MITPIDFDIPNVVGMRISGSVTLDDIQPWVSLLENKIKQEGKLRVYVEYESMTGLTWNAVFPPPLLLHIGGRAVPRQALSYLQGYLLTSFVLLVQTKPTIGPSSLDPVLKAASRAPVRPLPRA